MNGETYGTVVCTNLSTACHWQTAQLNEMRLTCSQLSLVIGDALRDATLTHPAPLTTLSPAEAFTPRKNITFNVLPGWKIDLLSLSVRTAKSQVTIEPTRGAMALRLPEDFPIAQPGLYQ
jgi:hypothetical protein